MQTMQKEPSFCRQECNFSARSQNIFDNRRCRRFIYGVNSGVRSLGIHQDESREKNDLKKKKNFRDARARGQSCEFVAESFHLVHKAGHGLAWHYVPSWLPSGVLTGCMRISNDYYLIVDVEATCSSGGAVPRQEMEIIEIGAVMQNARTFAIESEFQVFVHPVRHPRLTAFCTELTGIAQHEIMDAPPFPLALEAMTKWMVQFDDALFCSWGDYDRKQFIQDCDYHGVAYPFRCGHLNLKAEFSRTLNLPKKLGIAVALRHLGLEFEGSHHRGLDDARNIARIVRRICAGD
jgi:inhibitor of KinA sporulation pathway (predicted exonuclease)